MEPVPGVFVASPCNQIDAVTRPELIVVADCMVTEGLAPVAVTFVRLYVSSKLVRLFGDRETFIRLWVENVLEVGQ